MNGRLPQGALRPIAGGMLRADAAARWNAMNVYRRARGRSTILPSGPMSSYRTLAEQVFLRRQWCARGHCENAALPGTSNHGLGLAVDTPQSAAVAQDGARFGWAKVWSDAPWEPWHFRANLTVPVPKLRQPYWLTTIRRGSSGAHVKRLQMLLRRRGYLPRRWKAHTKYTLRVRRAVRLFQREHQLKVDGVVGPSTWRLLRR